MRRFNLPPETTEVRRNIIRNDQHDIGPLRRCIRKQTNTDKWERNERGEETVWTAHKLE